MRLLAIDTALEACSAAVLDTGGGGIIAQESNADDARSCRSADAADPAGHEGRAPRLFRARPHRGHRRARQLHRLACRHRRRARPRARRRQTGRRPVDAFGFRRAVHRRRRQQPVVSAIDARHTHVYLQVYGAAGRVLVAPRLASLHEAALRASAAGAPRLAGTAAELLADRLAGRRAAAERRRCPPRARYRMGGAARRDRRKKQTRRPSRFTCARPTPSRKKPAICRADDETPDHAVLRAASRPCRKRPAATPRRLPRCMGPRSAAAGARRKSRA